MDMRIVVAKMIGSLMLIPALVQTWVITTGVYNDTAKASIVAKGIAIFLLVMWAAVWGLVLLIFYR